MRVKLRKILIFVSVSVILYITYKIFEIDSQRKDADDFGLYQNDEHRNVINKKPNIDLGMGDGFNKPGLDDDVESKDLSRQQIVEQFVAKYKIDWDYPLEDSPWTIAAHWVSEKAVLPDFTPQLGGILKAMSTREITSADVGYKGTQLKLQLVLKGGQKVAFKPKRFSRDHVIEGAPYAGEDRHNGEIAAFHLSRLLDFRLTPLAVGRRVHLEEEIAPVASSSLISTFYKRGENTCFYGKCYYCKGEETGVCGEGKILEGTIILWLAPWVALSLQKHPWARTYRSIDAQWQDDDNYCKKVLLQHRDYLKGPRLLDIIDTTVLDFLVGNADRHHYETIGDGTSASMLMLDNAKSFGNPNHDETSILAPLYQCCMIRHATYTRLQKLKDGILSDVLQTLLSADPITPVISDSHLEAMDRRLDIILQYVEQCVVDKEGENYDVLIKER